MVVVPLYDLANQTFNVVLDDQYCTIRFFWKQIRLYMDLSVDGEVICQGVICENRTSILPFPVNGFSGTLHFFDTLGASAPHWDGLNSRYTLLFVSADEEIPASLRY